MPFYNTKDVGPVVVEIPAADEGTIVGSLMDCWLCGRRRTQPGSHKAIRERVCRKTCSQPSHPDTNGKQLARIRTPAEHNPYPQRLSGGKASRLALPPIDRTHRQICRSATGYVRSSRFRIDRELSWTASRNLVS